MTRQRPSVIGKKARMPSLCQKMCRRSCGSSPLIWPSARYQSLGWVVPSKVKPSPCRTVEWAPSQPISQSAASVSLSPLALRSTASTWLP